MLRGTERGRLALRREWQVTLAPIKQLVQAWLGSKRVLETYVGEHEGLYILGLVCATCVCLVVA